MTLTYIYHDCFVLDTARCLFIFDYWREPKGIRGSVSRLLSECHKPVVVLVSHFHKDHFNKEIFSWKEIVPDIHYIISKDTAKFARHYITPSSSYNGPLRTPPELVTTLRPLESLQINGVTIYAFGSTDIGNSYLLNVEGQWIFHSGDLNAWTLRDESTPAQIEAAIRDFKRCLQPIAALTPQIDVAMFPLDPRTGTGWLDGSEILLSTFGVGCFIPMHFCLACTRQQQQQYTRQIPEACSDLSARFPATLIQPLTSELSAISL